MKLIPKVFSVSQKSLFIAFLTFSAVVFSVWLASTTIMQMLNVKTTWNEYNQKAAVSSYNLSQLQNTIGYGGFIHNFKNFVLRKDAHLIPKIQSDLDKIKQSINKFSKLNLNGEEKSALQMLSSTFEIYGQKFELAKNAINEDKPSEDIDNLVKVDDTQALAALQSLAKIILNRSSIHQQQTDNAINKTVDYILLSFLAIPIILMVGWLLISFSRRITSINNDLVVSNNFLDTLVYSMPDAMLSVDVLGNIEKVNQEAAILSGFTEEELLNKNISDLLPERLRSKHQFNISDYFAGKFDYKKPMGDRDNLLILRKDGHETPVEIRLGFVNNPGKPMATATIRDISDRIAAQESLKKSEALLAEAQRIAKLGSWEWNLSDNLLNLSDESIRLLGINKQDFNEEYEVLLRNVHPDDRESVKTAIENAVKNHQPYDIEHRLMHKDGRVSFVREQGEVISSEDKQTKKLIGTMLDITGYKNEQIKLLQSASVFEHSSDAIVITDRDNKIIAANSAYTEVTGYLKHEVLGRNPGFSKSKRHDKAFYKKLWSELLTKGRWQGEIWDRRKNGEIYPKWLSISVLKDESGNICNYIGIFSDVSKAKQNEQELWQLAHHDSLTGLPNRLLFMSNLEQAFKQANRTKKLSAVLFIDLDDFKPINDIYGHLAGDSVLKEVAQRLKNSVRQADTVARYGGDEFTILLQDLESFNDIEIVTNKITEYMNKPIKVKENEFTVKSSIGISLFPNAAKDIATLIKHADLAMYYVKEHGRNNVQVYNESLEILKDKVD